MRLPPYNYLDAYMYSNLKCYLIKLLFLTVLHFGLITKDSTDRLSFSDLLAKLSDSNPPFSRLAGIRKPTSRLSSDLTIPPREDFRSLVVPCKARY